MSLEDIERDLPPVDDDNSRLYLGLRTRRATTRVLACELAGPGAGDVWPLPHPAMPDLPAENLYDWGPGRGGSMLAVALLSDACGPVACARLWPEFMEAVVRALPPDDWELSLARVAAWVSRRLLAGPQAEGGVPC